MSKLHILLMKTEAAYLGSTDLRWVVPAMLCSMAMSQEYYNYPDCHRQVHRFRGACYKKYNSYEEGIVAFKSRTNSNPALAHDDDFNLQNPTADPPYLSFKTIVIVVLLIFFCLLWNKLWAHVLIVSVMVRLDLARIVMVIAPLTTTLVWVIYIYVVLL